VYAEFCMQDIAIASHGGDRPAAVVAPSMKKLLGG
jgi:hypothetical protein